MNEQRLYRRIIRRETHQSRSTASVIVLSCIVVAAAYAGIEIVLALIGQPRLLVSPSAAISAYSSNAAWLPFAGIGAFVFGLVLIVIALVPTRRARHGAAHERMAVVVDDRTLAGALSDHTRRAVDIGPTRVRTSISRRRGIVTLTPTSGVPIDQARGQQAADLLLESLGLTPSVRARVIVSSDGVVGS